MPQHYFYGNRGGTDVRDLPPVGRIIFWTVMFLVFVPMCSFFAGMVGAAFIPASAYLTSPMLCGNGTLQIQQVDKPSKAWGTSFTVYDTCVDSQTGKTSDVSGSANMVVGLIAAVVITVVLGLFVISFKTINFLLGRQSTA
jgi:hypothetical protein